MVQQYFCFHGSFDELLWLKKKVKCCLGRCLKKENMYFFRQILCIKMFLKSLKMWKWSEHFFLMRNLLIYPEHIELCMCVYIYLCTFIAFPFSEHQINSKPCCLVQMTNWKIRCVWSSGPCSSLMLTNKPSRNRVCCLLPWHGRSKQVFAGTQKLLSRVVGAVMCSLLEQEPDLCDGFAPTAVNGGSNPRVWWCRKPPSVLFGLLCWKVSCRFSISQKKTCWWMVFQVAKTTLEITKCLVQMVPVPLGRNFSPMVSLLGFPALDFSFQGDHTAGKLTWIALQALNLNFGIFWDLQSEVSLGKLIVATHQHHYCLGIAISPGCLVLQPWQVRMWTCQGTRWQALAPREVVNHHPCRDFEKLVHMGQSLVVGLAVPN